MQAFSDKEWDEVIDHLKDAVGAEQAEQARRNPTARLVAAIPYLSGSEDPDRFAVSNLLTLWGAARADRLFGHRDSDDSDPFRRLATFHVGSQADPLVVDYGLTLLALVSLKDHVIDQDGDRARGRRNPVVTGSWNPDQVEAELQAELNRHPNLASAYQPFSDPALAAGYWQTLS